MIGTTVYSVYGCSKCSGGYEKVQVNNGQVEIAPKGLGFALAHGYGSKNDSPTSWGYSETTCGHGVTGAHYVCREHNYVGTSQIH